MKEEEIQAPCMTRSVTEACNEIMMNVPSDHQDFYQGSSDATCSSCAAQSVTMVVVLELLTSDVRCFPSLGHCDYRIFQ